MRGVPDELPTALHIPPASRGEEQVDQELALLPDPPRRARTLTVLILAIATAAALLTVVGLRREIAYALASGPPASLGDLRSAADATLEASENRPVRAEAMLGAAGGIRYERPFVSDSFRTLAVAGRGAGGDTVDGQADVEARDMWVEVRVPAGQESGRWEPPRSFVGRLVRLDAAGLQHRGLREALEQSGQSRVPAGAWLLVDGEDPADTRWAILVGAMFLGFAAWNLVTIARIVRKVRA